MSDYASHIKGIMARYRDKGVLIDANILLLLLIGLLDKRLISNFKHTKTFTTEDFETLEAFLSNFNTFITTPNIITEVGNLSGHLAENRKEAYSQVFANMIKTLEEFYMISADVAKMKEFAKLGITDAGIISLARDDYFVLTDDFALSRTLEKQGVSVFNFNHIRPLGWT
jgi:rRNA-processing protein FCF1